MRRSTSSVAPAEICRDPLDCFLAAYDEYLAGTRLYEDLPPAFAVCPVTPRCEIIICAQCHPGTAALYDQARAVTAYFRVCAEIFGSSRTRPLPVIRDGDA